MIDLIERKNPYIIGRPIQEPELFFGRDRLFEFISDNLQQGAQVILLHGQRRIGKSSVLAQIPHSVKLPNFAFVPLSLEGASQKPIGEVLHEMSRDTIGHFNLHTQLEVPTSRAFQRNPRLFIDQFLPALRQVLQTQNIVLLLDEFDALYNFGVEDAAGHLFPFLQSGVYEFPNLYMIPVVGRQLHDLPAMLTLFREAPNQEVGLLDRRSAEALITVPAKEMLTYELDAIDAILELSAGHPYFTQLICSTLFAQARTEQRWQVTRSDVKLIVDRAIELGEGGLGWFWTGIPLPERVVFAAAAEVPRARQIQFPEAATLDFNESEPLELLRECGVVLTDAILDSVLNLVDWKFLRSSGTRSGQSRTSLPPTVSTYRVTIELVRRWLLQRHPIRREIDELEKLNPEAQALYQAARSARAFGATLSIVSRLNRALSLNPNHFAALFELADCLAELRQFPQAIKHYKRAYLVDPVRVRDSYVKTLHDYGEELRDIGEYDDAIEQLEEALTIDPDNEDVQELLNQIRKSLKYNSHLQVVSLRSDAGRDALVSPNMREVRAPEQDLRSLRQNFDRLWNQIIAEAPSSLKDRALDRLSDLQKEIFTNRQADLATLVYVYQWSRNNLPEKLAQAVTEFIDQVTAKIGRQPDEDRSVS